MNIDNINRLIALVKTDKVSNWGVCDCLGGKISVHFLSDIPADMRFSSAKIRAFIDVDYDTSRDIYEPENHDFWAFMDSEDVSDDQKTDVTVEMLEHLRDTGEVKWNIPASASE